MGYPNLNEVLTSGQKDWRVSYVKGFIHINEKEQNVDTTCKSYSLNSKYVFRMFDKMVTFNNNFQMLHFSVVSTCLGIFSKSLTS